MSFTHSNNHDLNWTRNHDVDVNDDYVKLQLHFQRQRKKEEVTKNW